MCYVEFTFWTKINILAFSLYKGQNSNICLHLLYVKSRYIKLVKSRITAVPYLIINKTRWEFLFSLLPIHYIGFLMSNYTLYKFREHYNPYQNINLRVGPANLDSLGALMSFSMLVCSVWLKSLHVKNISAENTNTMASWPILSAITGRKCDAGRHNYPKGMENWNDNEDR